MPALHNNEKETKEMIRKVFPLVVVLALMAGAIIAQDKSVTLTGYLIDNSCAANHANDKTFATWVKTHGTSCAGMESCEKSGYAVFADDKLYKFDDNGNNSVADLLKNTKSKKGLHVKVEGTVDGDTIKVTKLTEVTE
jgi:predicted amidohydrolase YtcJ